MERNVVGWFEIYVNDMERAQVFYETVFACSMEDMKMPEGMSSVQMKAFPSTVGETQGPGAAGALVQMASMPGGGAGTIVYFSSEDCAVEIARVKEAGGVVMAEKMPIGDYGFIAMAQDTEGNMIGIHSMK